MTKFQKKLLTLRQQLIGARYFNALVALEFAMKFHTGKRLNGDPEFEHQISIALYALTLPDIMYREELICVIMLHDVREDYDVTDDEIRKIFIAASQEFIDRVSRAVENMTKVFRNKKKDEIALFKEMALDPIASIAKGCDRVHNNQTMSIKTIAKQKEHLTEVVELFLPMLKAARKNFPQQLYAYENIKHVLTSQVELISNMHAVVEKQNG